MIPNDGHILIQGTYKCVKLHGKETLGLQMERTHSEIFYS